MKTNQLIKHSGTLFVLAAFLGIMVSCGSDDDGISADSIVGTWEVTKIEGYEYFEGVKYPLVEDEDYDLGGLMTFTAEGDMIDHDEEGASGKWMIRNGVLIMNLYDDWEDEWFTSEFKIIKLNASEMIWEASDDDPQDGYYFKWWFKKVE